MKNQIKNNTYNNVISETKEKEVIIGEEPKTYCDRENGCMFCDLLLCDGSPRRRKYGDILRDSVDYNHSDCDRQKN